MRAILFKNGVEVRRGDYPDGEMKLIDFNIKGQPNPDNYEWKLLVEGVRPVISSIQNLIRAEVDNDISNIDHPHLKQIDVVYSAIKKPDVEILSLIENAESEANESLIKNVDRLKTMMLYMALERRDRMGLNITNKMQAILDKGDEYALKLWQNDAELKKKIRQVIDGENVDINSDWANE